MDRFIVHDIGARRRVGTSSALNAVGEDHDPGPVPSGRRPSEGLRTKAIAQATLVRPSRTRNSNDSQAAATRLADRLQDHGCCLPVVDQTAA
jgi:hypothetical protein